MSKMSNIHVAAQEFINQCIKIQKELSKDFPNWSWKHWWFDCVSNSNKLECIGRFCKVNDRHEQILIKQAIKQIVEEQIASIA